METEFLAEEYSLTWKGHIQHVRDAFTRLLQDHAFCDVTLYAEGRKIGAHKVLLSACSDYFSHLFEDFKEERPIIVLKGVQFDILQHILGFIYSGEVSMEMEKLNQFLETAEFLKIYGLIKDNILRQGTHSIASETENASNLGDEQTSRSEGVTSPCLIETQVEEHPLITQIESVYPYSPPTTDNQPVDFQQITERTLAARLLESEGYGFFKQKNDLMPRRPQSCRIESHSVQQEPDPNIRDTKTEVRLQTTELGLQTNKYPIHSPPRHGDWTSDYENRSKSVQSNVSEMQSSVQINVDDDHSDPDSTPKRKRIKSERVSGDLEEIDKIKSLDQRDFANSLDAEIDISYEDEDDDSLETEMLKTCLAGVTDEGFQCKICNKVYIKKDSLKKHFSIHTKNTTCMICGLTLSRRTHLKRHLAIHGVDGQ